MMKNTGIDLILDMAGPDYLDRNLENIKARGISCINRFRSDDRGNIDLGHLITQNLTIMGSVLHPLAIKEKAQLSKEIQNQLLPLLKSSRLHPKIHSCFVLEDFDREHVLMLSNNCIGKIILTVDDTIRR
ncbi:hypothetical protein [Bacteroidetes bacterium endosymbiont of Geopemphigus sp.]|uniref:hypothetical protein n=1 Tax=Bacteroidetes bacterium endosymbiont of Geopemphigus sp. TaxID=2047937 RepID=UPI0011AF5DDE|nr:hypothetical protein [Bacteroidetes bacterium endosymbiont of Geopemphigus sp.]